MKIYKPAVLNRPIQQSVVSNTIYDNYGYVMTYYSMGAGTEISPERLNHHAAYYIDEGKVTGVYNENQTSYELKQGDLYIRPANVLMGFHADEDAVFTEFIFPNTSNVGALLAAGAVLPFASLISFRQNGEYRVSLIDDPNADLYLESYDAGVSGEERKVSQKVMLLVLEGRGKIITQKDTEQVSAGTVFNAAGGTYRLTADTKLKAVLLDIHDPDYR